MTIRSLYLVGIGKVNFPEGRKFGKCSGRALSVSYRCSHNSNGVFPFVDIDYCSEFELHGTSKKYALEHMPELTAAMARRKYPFNHDFFPI